MSAEVSQTSAELPDRVEMKKRNDSQFFHLLNEWD